MALNLAKAGTRLVVWNRSAERAEPLRALGASVAADVDEAFARARVVLVMLLNEEVTDTVPGSVEPDYSRALAAGVSSPLLDLSSALYGESVRLGNGRLDMVSVIEAIEARTDALGRPSDVRATR